MTLFILTVYAAYGAEIGIVVAVCDCADVLAADAADFACCADCAGAVAVCDCAVVIVIAADAADIFDCSADCAGAVAVFDCAV